jgi:hypothetical protein
MLYRNRRNALNGNSKSSTKVNRRFAINSSGIEASKQSVVTGNNIFRIHDRPPFHQLEPRVKAHVMVAFLGYALWVTLKHLLKRRSVGSQAIRQRGRGPSTHVAHESHRPAVYLAKH